MPIRILIVTASTQEAGSVKAIKGVAPFREIFRFGNYEISLLITGIGSISTAWAMTKWISVNDRPDLAINAGIAGSYRDIYPVGNVVMPVSDCFADAGIEDGERFLTLYEAGFAEAGEFPFTEGSIRADSRYITAFENLIKPVKAITVNTVTGSGQTRDKLVKKFNPDIETMEGATFFYICARENIPFLALRAISNRVETRDRSKWNIPLAIGNLSEKIRLVFTSLEF